MTARVKATLGLVLLVALTSYLLWRGSGPGGDDAPEVPREGQYEAVPASPDEPTVVPGESAPATLQGRSHRDEPGPGERGVRVIVRSKVGIPVPGAFVVVCWHDGKGSAHVAERETGADGSIFLADVPHDGSARVMVQASVRHKPSVDAEKLRVTAPELVATVDEGLPLRVRCFDDLTGREMYGVPVRGVEQKPSADEAFPEGDDWILALVGPGQREHVRFLVVPPPGYVAWDRREVLTSVGTWTRELEFLYPLRREAEVYVSVLDHEGRPESRADLDAFFIAGIRSTAGHKDHLGPGAFRLRGVPFFREAVLSVVASSPDHEDGISKFVTLPARPTERTELVLTLPPPRSEHVAGGSAIGIGGGAGGSFGGRGRSSKTGDALIEVRRYDGTPASNARVHVGRRVVSTDAAGRARVTRLPVGEHEVSVHAIGLLPISGVVVVTEGAESRLALDESPGGAIDVRVTDREGVPLPFATIHVRTPSGGAWVDEYQGRQRLDPFTDHRGHRRLARVEAGRVELRVDWGGRRARVTVDVPEGRLAEVTLVPQ